MRAEEALLILNCNLEVIGGSSEAENLFGIRDESVKLGKLIDLAGDSPQNTPGILDLQKKAGEIIAGRIPDAAGSVEWGGARYEWKMSLLSWPLRRPKIAVCFRKLTAATTSSDIGDYREAFEKAVEGLFRTSIDGHYLEVNPALARMYGYRSPAQLMSKLRDLNTQLYVQPTRRAEFVKLIQEQGVVSDFESQVVRADGSVMWIAEFGRVVRVASGEPFYFEGSVIDTTARKLAEAAIKANEEKYRQLVEMTSVVPWEADLKTGAFTYVGPQALEFLGYPLARWLEVGFWQGIVHAEDRAWVTIARAEAIEKRQRFECEYRLIRQDGEVVWAREIVSVLPGIDGHSALGGFMLDVTYRRESEASLLESQDFIEQIAAASPVISYLYDPARRQGIYVNGRTTDILGYTKRALSEIQPFFLLALAHPDEEADHLAYFSSWAEVAPDAVRKREFRLRNVNGGWIWLRSRERVFRKIPGTESLRIVGTLEDITFQRNAMEDLAENERIFRRLAETTGAVPFDFDLATQRFTYVGPQAEGIFGYPLRRWFSADFWSGFVFPNDAEEGNRFKDESSRALMKDFQTVFRVSAADGHLIWLRQIVHRAADEDQRLTVRGFFFDVTEARLVEDERENSRMRLRELSARGQEMREVERKSIAREIHDELGQALTLLAIDLSRLGTRVEKTVTSEGKQELLDRIRFLEGAVQSTVGVVRRILSSLRPPLLDELGLKEAIEWQVEDFSRRVGLRYELQVAPVQFLSPAAATVVFRIFQEILTNVARHAKASRIKVFLSEGDGGSVLRVDDNGIGITEERLSQTKNLGILGMRERAWSVGGEMEITGQAGGGTSIVVRIPTGNA